MFYKLGFSDLYQWESTPMFFSLLSEGCLITETDECQAVVLLEGQGTEATTLCVLMVFFKFFYQELNK